MKIFNLKKKNDDYSGNYWENDFLSFYPGFKQLNFNLKLDKAKVHFSFGYGQFYFSFKKLRNKLSDSFKEKFENKEYGFYFYNPGGGFPDSFWLRKGKKTLGYDLPWAYTWIKSSRLKKDGGWEHSKKGDIKDFYDNSKYGEILYSELCSYQYVLNSGEVQKVIAKIIVQKTEWRQKWLKWTRLFRKVKKYIDVEFSEGIGESSGSYKGGTTGCDYNMLKNETPIECLRRMEVERKFR